MRILVKNKIYLYNPPSNLANAIKKSLTLPNPAYEVMRRKGNMKALYAVPQNFKYYQEQGIVMAVGRGMAEKVGNYCDKNGIEVEAEFDLCINKIKDKLESDTLKLRDYQEGVPEQILEESTGIIKLSVGFGKTICAAKLTEITQLTTLIIVPRNSILEQFKQEFEKYYGVKIGVIKGKEMDICPITVASIQTLQKRDLSQIRDMFGMVIVDECHQFITDKRLKVIQSFNPCRLYGMSGTPARTDEQGDAIGFTFGKILVDKSLPQTAPLVKLIETNIPIQAEEYYDMVEAMVNSRERTMLVADKIWTQVKHGRKVLVLTKRINHYEKIDEFLKKHFKTYCINSKDKDKDRNELLKGLREGTVEFDVVFGTYSMLSTGVDLMQLDTLVIAGDLKSSVLTEQSAGRILRLFKDKKSPLILDFVDNKNRTFRRQSYGRRAFYNSIGWKVEKYKIG